MSTRHSASRARVPDATADNEAINRKLLLQRDGGLNTVPALYKSITRRFEVPFNVYSFGDSRFEGISSNASQNVGAPTWGDTWPILLIRQLRAALGLPQGGRGWLPLQLTDADTAYRFKVSELRAGNYSNQRGTLGIPGCQYVATVASGGQRIRLFTDPDTTSLDFYTQSISGNGYAVRFRTQLGAVIDVSPAVNPRTQVTRIPNPGSWVEFESTAGGFHALGAMEYVGDENSGIRALNFGVSGAMSSEGAAAVTRPGMADLISMLVPSMVVTGYGGNDMIQNATASSLTANLNAIKAALAVPMLTSTAVLTGSLYASGVPYNAAIKASNWDVLMDPAALGNTDADFPGWFTSDGVHYSQTGTAAQADIAVDALLGRQASPAGRPGRLVTTSWFESHALDWVNVRTYGAVGDGIVDDGPALVRAANAAIALGRPLYVPAGYYSTSLSLPTLPNNFVIRGDGARSSTIMYTGTGTLIAATSVQNVRVYDLDFYATAAGATLFDLSACFVWSIFSCLIRGNHPNGTTYRTQRGIVLRDNTGGCRIIDTDINNLGRGIVTSCIQNHVIGAKFATNYIGVLGTGSNNSAGLNMTMTEFDAPKDDTTTFAHVWIDGPANEWNFTQVWWEGGDKSLIVGAAGVGGPSKLFMSGCKMAARTTGLELNHCRQPHIVNTQFDIDQNSIANYKELTINPTYVAEGVADNLITTVRDDFQFEDFPQYWSVTLKGWTGAGALRVRAQAVIDGDVYAPSYHITYLPGLMRVLQSNETGQLIPTHKQHNLLWDAEMPLNSAAIAAGYVGYSDAIGGVQVSNAYSTDGIMLDSIGFRIADPAGRVTGGVFQVQFYLGSPTSAEDTLIATMQLAADQNNQSIALATPIQCPHNAVLRAKVTAGSASIPGTAHVHWRGRYIVNV